MTSLQEIIYKKLPKEIKLEIKNNPKRLYEYNIILQSIKDKMYSNYNDKIKSIKQKISLNKDDIQLMYLLLIIYYHIISYPPNKYIPISEQSQSMRAWNNFIKKYYPHFYIYKELQTEWSKNMWLIYYTYMLSYKSFYNLPTNHRVFTRNKINLIPNYTERRGLFINYIYKLYKQLSLNFNINQLNFYQIYLI